MEEVEELGDELVIADEPTHVASVVVSGAGWISGTWKIRSHGKTSDAWRDEYQCPVRKQMYLQAKFFDWPMNARSLQPTTRPCPALRTQAAMLRGMKQFARPGCDNQSRYRRTSSNPVQLRPGDVGAEPRASPGCFSDVSLVI